MIFASNFKNKRAFHTMTLSKFERPTLARAYLPITKIMSWYIKVTSSGYLVIYFRFKTSLFKSVFLHKQFHNNKKLDGECKIFCKYFNRNKFDFLPSKYSISERPTLFGLICRYSNSECWPLSSESKRGSTSSNEQIVAYDNYLHVSKYKRVCSKVDEQNAGQFKSVLVY